MGGRAQPERAGQVPQWLESTMATMRTFENGCRCNTVELSIASESHGAPALPGRESVQRVFGARAVFCHQAKVVVVLEAGAALESYGGQRGILHLCSPLVGLAVARGGPAAGDR